jgi:uracil DNA glycosylase
MVYASMIPDGWEDFFIANSTLIDCILDTIIQSETTIHPKPELVFEMFYRMHPDDIQLMLFNQEPYASHCPITSIKHACGIAFAIPNECKIMPTMLQDIAGIIIDKQLDSWIAQGVFLGSLAWTRGTKSHLLVWEELTRNLVFGLVGQRTWVLSEEVIRKNAVVKCEKIDFKKINELMQNAFGTSIRWNSISQSKDNAKLLP